MQTNQQVRVIDPILTNFALGYKHQERVGTLLFPLVTVFVSGGQVLEFGKESFKLYNSRRAPGANTRRIDVGYAGRPFALIQDALESPLPREHMRDANVLPGIDLGRLRVNALMMNATLNHEVEAAGIATNPANYPSSNKRALSGTDRWDDPASRPIPQIDEGKEAVRAEIGVEPNVFINTPKGHIALKNNPSVLDRFKYTTADQVTEAMLAQLLEVDVYRVGKSTYVDSSDAFADVWTNPVMAYVPPETINETARYAPSGQITFETPSYGYTYVMDGHPLLEEPYWDNNCKSWIYGCTFERVAVQTSLNAGFLFTSVTSS